MLEQPAIPITVVVFKKLCSRVITDEAGIYCSYSPTRKTTAKTLFSSGHHLIAITRVVSQLESSLV